MSLNPLALRLRPTATRHVSSATRAFSATNPNSKKTPSRNSSQSYENVVPPESPRYIRFHQPVQSEEVKQPRVRGHLPQPREIFTKEEGQRKLTEAFLADTVPKGKNRTPVNAVQAEKKHMADYRRRNLESGIKALWKRKTITDAKRTQETERKRQTNIRARDARGRKADLFSGGSFHSSILDTSVKPDPDRFAEADRSRTRVAQKEISKRESRSHALMELYMNARNFIVTEAELREEVEKVFSQDYFQQQSKLTGRQGAPENIWGVHGNPPSVSQMLQRNSNDLLSASNPAHERAALRQKKIAEEFTGGKMDSQA